MGTVVEKAEDLSDVDTDKIDDAQVVGVMKLTKLVAFNYDHLLEICEHAA